MILVLVMTLSTYLNFSINFKCLLYTLKYYGYWLVRYRGIEIIYYRSNTVYYTNTAKYYSNIFSTNILHYKKLEFIKVNK